WRAGELEGNRLDAPLATSVLGIKGSGGAGETKLHHALKFALRQPGRGHAQSPGAPVIVGAQIAGRAGGSKRVGAWIQAERGGPGRFAVAQAKQGGCEGCAVGHSS